MVDTMITKRQVQGVDHNEPGKGYIQEFQKQLAIAEQETVKSQTPFCRACAWNTFHDITERQKTDIMRRTGAVRQNEAIFYETINTFDFSAYTGLDKFTHIKDTPAINQVRLEGHKQPITIGFNCDFECKVMPVHKQTIMIPTDQYEAFKARMATEYGKKK